MTFIGLTSREDSYIPGCITNNVDVNALITVVYRTRFRHFTQTSTPIIGETNHMTKYTYEIRSKQKTGLDISNVGNAINRSTRWTSTATIWSSTCSWTTPVLKRNCLRARSSITAWRTSLGILHPTASYLGQGLDKPSKPRSGCLRVRAVVALNAADNRHTSPPLLTICIPLCELRFSDQQTGRADG